MPTVVLSVMDLGQRSYTFKFRFLFMFDQPNAIAINLRTNITKVLF